MWQPTSLIHADSCSLQSGVSDKSTNEYAVPSSMNTQLEFEVEILTRYA